MLHVASWCAWVSRSGRMMRNFQLIILTCYYLNRGRSKQRASSSQAWNAATCLFITII
jgi:hypothetical protein